MFVPLFPFPVPIQHGSNTNYRPTPPAAPRPETRRCDFCHSPGEKKTDSLTNSKWQIGLGWRQKVARREPERSAASAKRAVTTHWGSRGAAPARLWFLSS